MVQIEDRFSGNAATVLPSPSEPSRGGFDAKAFEYQHELGPLAGPLAEYLGAVEQLLAYLDQHRHFEKNSNGLHHHDACPLNCHYERMSAAYVALLKRLQSVGVMVFSRHISEESPEPMFFFASLYNEDELLAHLRDQHAHLKQQVRQIIKLAISLGNYVLVDALSEMLVLHEKAVWLLETKDFEIQ